MIVQSRVSPLTLPKQCVYVAGEGEVIPSGWEECRVGENIKFNPIALATYFFRNRDDIVYDVFLLMAAVEFCDYSKKRPQKGWGREFHLSVPVSDPDHWCSPTILEPLISALKKLTGDQWSVEFRKRAFSPDWPDQSILDIQSNPQAVIAYSDGMDSLSVSELVGRELGDKLVRVRLGKNERKRGLPFVAVPYRVNLDKKESTGRSRGFKFSMLAGAAAYLSGAPQIIVPESGQGALGPVLVKAGRIPGDFRNHPAFFVIMTRLLAALFERSVTFEIPRLWCTKGETLAKYIKASGDTKLWRQTVSCWRGSRQTSVNNKKRQCGICAACLLRRMSIHAAGELDDSDAYLWNNLSAKEFEQGAARSCRDMHDLKAHRKYAIAGMFHLTHMAELISRPISAKSFELDAGETARALGMTKDDVMSKQKHLLERHAHEWNAFLDSLDADSFVHKWAKGKNANAA